MRIGLPKEIKNQEYRVGMVPATTQSQVRSGHQVFIQKSAGEGRGIAAKHLLLETLTLLAFVRNLGFGI